jgi:hypothetical protein
MCDFSGKLIAWMDRELPAEVAASVAQHLEVCGDCRSRVDAYRRLGASVDGYCDETLAAGVRARSPRWLPAAVATGAVAALVALFVVWPKASVRPHAHPPQSTTARVEHAIAEKSTLAPAGPIRRISRPRSVRIERSHVQDRNAVPVFAGNENNDAASSPSMIQIAIPSDEMFPPGAVPEGVQFVADVTIGADGSAERLRLRPRLATFERKGGQP